MARTVKLAPAEKSTAKAKRVISPSRFSSIRNNLPAIVGAAALVAAGALAGTALAHNGPGGSDGRHPGQGMEARMNMHRDHSGQHDSGKPNDRVGLTGTATSVSPTELSITLANGTSKTFALDAMSQYFTQTAGTAADVTVGSYVLVDGGRPASSAAVTAKGIAVLTSGRTDVRLHLGHPAKVTAVNGSTLTLEVVTPRGTKTITVTIGSNTVISTIATATNADLTVGSNVVVDLGREAAAAKLVLIIK
jgi:hypothetical protein